MLLAGAERRLVSTWGPLTVPDSFVVNSNKVGAGAGEAKFYLGGRTDRALRRFFGPKGFEIECLFLRNQLLTFLDDIKGEYDRPTQPYRHRADLRRLWKERRQEIASLRDDEVRFTVREQVAGGVRCYVKGGGRYSLLRNLPLPNRANVYFDKMEARRGDVVYLVRLVPLAHEGRQPEDREAMELAMIRAIEVDRTIADATRKQLINARVGQGQFRDGVLQQCGVVCPVTGVRDSRLLVASHIKPWRHAVHKEKLDPQNGLALSATIDRLFDAGLITFGDDSSLRISPQLSAHDAQVIGLREGRRYPKLPVTGRENARRRAYLEYHRESIFLV